MAVFECTLLYTDSTTRVQWLKDNKPLEDRLADRLTASATGKTFRLTLQNVLESDSGIYIARAMNSEGQSTCTAQLIVQQRESVKFALESSYIILYWINHFFSLFLSSYSWGEESKGGSQCSNLLGTLEGHRTHGEHLSTFHGESERRS